MTDLVDNDPNMPDALEVAAKEDAYFKSTGKLIGPLHGVVFAVKDWYDTFDMRTTAGADAAYANDSAASRRHVRHAPARRRRHHHRQGECRQRDLAQPLRRSQLQPVRHRALSRHVEQRLRIVGRRQPGDLRDCRGNRRLNSAPDEEQRRRRPGADTGARQPQRHVRRRLQHARRSDLPHGEGRGESARRHRRLRSQGRAHGLLQSDGCLPRRTRASPTRGGSTGCASV